MTAFAIESQFDRRQLSDRRQRPTSLWGTLRWQGRRRKGFRRAGEGINAYVDCVAPRGMAARLNRHRRLCARCLANYWTFRAGGRGGQSRHGFCPGLWLCPVCHR